MGGDRVPKPRLNPHPDSEREFWPLI